MNHRSKVGLMLCCLGICGTAAVVHSGFQLHSEAPPKPAELYEVVFEQIHAFRTADYSRAYQQVSSTFQERFNIEAFSSLIRTDYPDLLRAEHVEFGPVQSKGRHAVIQVYFVLRNGEIVPCVYSLINEDHVWKIDGARVQKRWPSNRRLGGIRT